jgi:hypothetical protein
MSRIPAPRALAAIAAIALVLAFALPVGGAARPLAPPPPRAAAAQGSAGFLASLWQTFVQIWTDNGSAIDPYGGG